MHQAADWTLSCFVVCPQVLERLHQSCRNFDGSDNTKEHSGDLIDIYALRVRFSCSFCSSVFDSCSTARGLDHTQIQMASATGQQVDQKVSLFITIAPVVSKHPRTPS